MSNHWHGVVSDPEGRLPEFLEYFHRMVAKVQNASLGRWENFWSSDKTSAVLLVSDQDVLDKIAYTIANPTAAGLVRSPLEWPGVTCRRFGERHTIEMPDTFFDDEGDLPDEVVLEFVRPGILAGLSETELNVALQDAVAARVRRARKDLELRGLRFLGRNAVLQQPSSEVPKRPAARRNPNPRIASKSTSARVSAIRRMLAFVKEYREAWLSWRAGNRAVVFPAGTYALRIYAGVACAQSP